MKIEIELGELNLLTLAAREALYGRVDEAWWRARSETSKRRLEKLLVRLDEAWADGMEKGGA